MFVNGSRSLPTRQTLGLACVMDQTWDFITHICNILDFELETGREFYVTAVSVSESSFNGGLKRLGGNYRT